MKIVRICQSICEHDSFRLPTMSIDDITVGIFSVRILFGRIDTNCPLEGVRVESNTREMPVAVLLQLGRRSFSIFSGFLGVSRDALARREWFSVLC